MNALIHLDQNGKKVMERRVHEAVMKERADISTRAQYVWALSMLQCGLMDAYCSARGRSFRGGAGQIHGISDRGFRRPVHALDASRFGRRGQGDKPRKET